MMYKVENEYNLVEGAFHEKGQSYVRWAANMAVGLQTGVPWLMCKQDDAPNPVVSVQFFLSIHYFVLIKKKKKKLFLLEKSNFRNA